MLIFLTGMHAETQLKCHKTLALYVLVLGFMHSSRIFIAKPVVSPKKLTGAMMLFSVLLFAFLGVLMKFCIKSRMNLFIFIHRIFFIVICLGAYFHGAYWVLYLGLVGVFFEGFIRILFMIKNRYSLVKPTFELLGENYVKISFSKRNNFKFKPGQYCYFYAPWFSLYNLHPFSITNSNEENKVVFIIKKEGKWTSKLYEYV